MFELIPISQVRPSMLEGKKDETYHCNFARYCLGQANNQLHSQWLWKIQKNKRFYKGDQWVDSEDIDTFLKDDDNQDRNRLSIVQNIIRPMVNSYRGNAIRMNINFQVKSISPQVVNRRETKLAQMLHLTKVANQPENPFGPEIKKRYPVGNSEGETMSQFSNTYVDKYVRDMNNLARYVSNRNKFVDKQAYLAMNMAFTGLGVMNYFEYAGHQEFRVVPSEMMFWDRSCREEDFSDASFMGEIHQMWPAEIFEMWPDIKDDDRKAIDRYSQYFSTINGAGRQSSINGTFNSNGRVPVFKVYWQDSQADTYGYVKDEYGYEYLTKINYVYDGEDKPRYTDKDLIKATSPAAKKLYKRWGGKLSGKNHDDVLRVAFIIPKEIIGSCDENQRHNNTYNDITLDWGIAPYQETEMQEYQSVKYPYKCATWAYVDGEVMSPIDDAIDPQRFINRVWSMAENQLNNAPGTGVFIDSSMVDDQSEIQRNMNQSKPSFLDGRGRSLQNAVVPYSGAQNTNTAMGMFNVIEAMKVSVKETTGLNDALQGNTVGTGNDQLVGVTQLMIERGSLLQEPFYNALTHVFEQCFDAIVTVGKRIYIESERALAIAVGDDGAELLKLSKDLRAEDFRCFVKRENSDEILVGAGNQQLLLFKQLGMLDDKRISKLWGRATPDDVATAVREYAQEKEEIQRMSQRDQQAQQQQAINVMQQEQAQQQNMATEQMARDDIKELTSQKADIQKEMIKSLTKLAPQNRQAERMVINSAKNLQNQSI